MSGSPKDLIRTNPYSVYSGVAAEDIEKDSVVLKIICPELIPNTAFGAVGAGITQSTIKLQDRDGNALSSSITSANHLVATWEGQTNVRYPPMIRKGEPVELFKTVGQDKFEWRTKGGKGREFRTTDRMVMEIGASDPNKPGVAKDDTNTYSVYLDSHEKKVGLKTSAANGEVTAFSMEADLAKGTFHISDNGKEPGNRIFLDTGDASGVPVFQVNLSSGVTLKFENENVFLKVPGKLQIDVTERFVINSPITVFNLGKVGTVIVNAANIALNTGKDFVVTAGGVIGLNSASTKISGILIAGALRVATAVKGAIGSVYKPATIQRPQDTPVVTPINTPDTAMTGPPYT